MNYLPMGLYIAIWCKLQLVKFYGPDSVLSCTSKSKVITLFFHTLDLHQYKPAESGSAYFNYILLKTFFPWFLTIQSFFSSIFSYTVFNLFTGCSYKMFTAEIQTVQGDMELTPGVCLPQYSSLLILFCYCFKKDIKWSWLLYFWLKTHLYDTYAQIL